MLQAGDTLVCALEDGEPWPPLLLTTALARVIGTLKDIPVLRFHDLRHSHASQLLAAGVHPKVVQERLGHSTITTTLDLYSHVAETIQVDAATRLDAVFRGAINGPGGGK
jgi:integrase